MRCDQWIGLTKEARAFLDEHAAMIPGDKCPQCGCILNHKRDCQEYRDVNGMFNTTAGVLIDFKLKDGRTAREVVQAEVWTSEPCVFICLRIDGVMCFEWSKEEINNA